MKPVFCETSIDVKPVFEMLLDPVGSIFVVLVFFVPRKPAKKKTKTMFAKI